MKRKSLITATAVLLVAVMCLATASYAWFTAGQSAKVTAFEFGIDQGDAAIQLAPVDMRDHTNVGTYTNTLKPDSWNKDWAVKATEFVPVSSADGKNFFPVGDYDTTTETWTSIAAAKDGYLYFVFNIKAPSAGTATLNFTAAGTGSETFTKASKLAVKVGEADVEIFDMVKDTTDSYFPMVNAGAECEKNADGYFVPVDGATGFAADARTQKDYAPVEVEFTGEDVTTVVVAYWVEGMDKDCSGTSWNMSAQSLKIDIDWAA